MADFRYVDNERFDAELQRIINDHYEAGRQRREEKFFVALSGGSMPTLLLRIFLRFQRMDWTRWVFFFCDERLVPLSSPDSNAGTYKRLFEEHSKALPFKEEQFVYVNTELPGEDAAAAYQAKFEEHFGVGNMPRFHIMFLGIGEDGHTCSLFPEHELLEVSLARNICLS